MSVTVQSLYIT